jgi:Mrp family chromosome partitioning ATPase
MDPTSTIPPNEDHLDPDGSTRDDTGENKLIRLAKTIIIISDGAGEIDGQIVAPQYYNCFNYSLLPQEQTEVKLVLGITSPNPKEGKTLVASNLAVALAMSQQRKTVLVDLNIQEPHIHKVFGASLSPGLVEAFTDVRIYVSATEIKDLYILPAGGGMARPLGLDQLSFFRDVIYSLAQEFDFVIVDMPSMNVPGFPILFANHLNGLFVVLNVGKTKRADVDRMFRLLNEGQVYGFVFNRCKDEVSSPKERR